MRAITVRQPWAAALAMGWKPVENRGRHFGWLGEIAIHAGLKEDPSTYPVPDARRAFQRLGGRCNLWNPRGFQLTRRPEAFHPALACGAVIAVAEVTGCHRAVVGREPTCCQPWGQPVHYGPSGNATPAHHISLANVRLLPDPVPCTGKQMMPWLLPPDVTGRVWAQLAEMEVTRG